MISMTNFMWNHNGEISIDWQLCKFHTSLLNAARERILQELDPHEKQMKMDLI